MAFPGRPYVKQNLAIQSAWLAVLIIGILAGRLIPEGPYMHGHGIDGQMLTWDGLWYLNIAQHGYSWDAANGTKPWHYQNVAFFPGYPILEWIIIRITGNASPWLMILPGLIGQCLAVSAFRRFASGILNPANAVFATWLFCLWPACCFLAMGYPTGFINLFAIQTVSSYRAGRPFAASVWCGLGTAFAPTMVFIAAILCLDFAIQKSNIIRKPVSVVCFGIITVSGLLCFMLYLAMEFHDPFVFTKAQDAFNITPPFFLHLETMLDLKWYGLVITHFRTEIYLALHHQEAATAVGRERIEAAFQLVVNLAAVVIIIAGLIAARVKLTPAWLPGTALSVLIGYLWFIATTDHNLIDGTRLLYPAIAIFLGLGAVIGKSRVIRVGVIAIFAGLSVLETALIASGYSII
jgi:hypothetical protein